MILNTVLLVGIVGRDPELEKRGEADRCFLTVGCPRSYNREKIDWVRVYAWRSTANFIAKYFHKGDHIGIRGVLRVDEWTDANGVRKSSTYVEVDEAEFVERPRNAAAADNPRTGAAAEIPQAVASENAWLFDGTQGGLMD